MRPTARPLVLGGDLIARHGLLLEIMHCVRMLRKALALMCRALYPSLKKTSELRQSWRRHAWPLVLLVQTAAKTQLTGTHLSRRRSRQMIDAMRTKGRRGRAIHKTVTPCQMPVLLRQTTRRRGALRNR